MPDESQISKEEMKDALFDIMEKQTAVMNTLYESLARGAGLTIDETRDLGVLVMEVTRSLQKAMEAVDMPIKEPIDLGHSREGGVS